MTAHSMPGPMSAPVAVHLHERVVLVTGGSGAMGQSLATTLARCGARVVLLARNADRLGVVATGIAQATGAQVRWVAADLTDRSAAAETGQAVWNAFGRVDAVVNSAVPAGCQQPLGDLLSTPEDTWWEVFDPIVLGALGLAKQLAPRMREAGGGAFINLCSPTGVTPYPGMDAYGLAKGALIVLTRYMAREWGAWNIRANALTPGLIADGVNLVREALDADPALQGLLSRTSLGRAGAADELGQVVAFLASPASSFLSGAVIPVDGGRF